MRFKAVIDRIEGRIAVLVPERAPEIERASAAGGEPGVDGGREVDGGPEAGWGLGADRAPGADGTLGAGHTPGAGQGPGIDQAFEAGCFDIPADFLPAGAKEGDVVIFDLKIDREETRQRQERVQGLIDRLVEKTRRRGGSP